MRHLRNLTIMITNKCLLNCSHCSIGSHNLNRNVNTLETTTLESYIREIFSAGRYELIVFAGGEPSLEPELLAHGFTVSKKLGIKTAMVTAPIWAKTYEKALLFVDKIQKVDFITLSFDFYHLEKIDVSHYVNAILAAKIFDIKVAINACYGNKEEMLLLEKIIGMLPHGVIYTNWRRTLPVGNAIALQQEYFDITKLENIESIYSIPKSCRIGDVLLDFDAKIHACCWSSSINDSPLCVIQKEKESSLLKMLDSLEENIYFSLLFKNGLIDSLKGPLKKYVFDRFNGRCFINECHLCMQLLGDSVFLQKLLEITKK